MKNVITLVAVALLATPVFAAQVTYNYGWEDGVGTILGSYGNVVDPTNVTGSQVGEAGTDPDFTVPGPNSGDHYLHVAEEPHSSTPQAYVAFIEGLTDGDVVDASFFGYDVSPGLSPSLRVWGHYANSGDVNSYAGSAGGNSTYTAGTGWDQVSHSWTFDSDSGTRDALVVEVRLYSYPTTDSGERSDFFVDDLEVTAPDTATVTFAPEPASLLLVALGALIRRR